MLLRVLTLVHIGAGIAALGSLCVPLVTRKGGLLHRKAGWMYVVSVFVVTGTITLIVPSVLDTLGYSPLDGIGITTTTGVVDEQQGYDLR